MHLLNFSQKLRKRERKKERKKKKKERKNAIEQKKVIGTVEKTCTCEINIYVKLK